MEKLIPTNRAWRFLVTVTLFGGYVWLRMRQHGSVRGPRLSFGDTGDYLDIASRPLLSSTFWVAEKPSGAPLLFKVFEANPEYIISAQFWISILAWGVLAVAVHNSLLSHWLKPLGFGLILSFGLTQNVILWEPLILSDSLSVSLMVIFFALSFWLITEWNIHKFALFAAISILMVLVRDSYSYFLLMVGGALFILSFFVSPPGRMRMIWVSIFFAVLYMMNSANIAASRRWESPFINVVGIRVLANPDYISYFEARGMPITDAVMELKGELSYGKELMYYHDPRLEDLRQWVRANGLQEFRRFLWFYKADTLQLPLTMPHEIINADLYYYAATGYRPIIRDQRLNEVLYPLRFGLLALLWANFLAAVLIIPAFHFRRSLWMIPLMLIFFSYPQAVLMWNADPHDIGRHSLYHNIQWRIGLWLLILFLADLIFRDWKALLRLIRNKHDP